MIADEDQTRLLDFLERDQKVRVVILSMESLTSLTIGPRISSKPRRGFPQPKSAARICGCARTAAC